MQKDYQKPLLLTFKWTVSRGRDTYGYNICSLYVDGSKIASVNGGGYDMQGSVLGQYLAKEYQPRLMAIADRASHVSTQGEDMQWQQERKDGLYGMTLIQPRRLTAHVSLDGACGESSMVKIAKAAGIELTATQTGRNQWGYFLTEVCTACGGDNPEGCTYC